MDLYKEVGLRIRFLRETKKYTRDRLAEKAEISTKFLYEIEVGNKGFSAETLYKLSSALGVSADYILTGTENEIATSELQTLLNKFEPAQKYKIERLLEMIYDMYEESH